MDTVAEETKTCKVCRQQIEAARHRMHELGCMRQNYWCDTCEVAVPKGDKEEHEETMHSMKACQFCGMQMMAMKVADHENNCSEAPTGCKFCDEKVAPSAMLDHMNICGAKTYQCGECGEWVKRAEKREHVQEGFCDVIKESKAEAAEIAAEKEKKAH